MKLTTRGRYAVTAMLDISVHGQTRPTALAEISSRQEISLSYLEQLFAKLRRKGLVRSIRGPGGGYMLAAPAATISIADIIRAVDEPLQATSCNSPEGCRSTSRCITHHFWQRLGEHLNSYLESVSLALLTQENHDQVHGPSSQSEKKVI